MRQSTGGSTGGSAPAPRQDDWKGSLPAAPATSGPGQGSATIRMRSLVPWGMSLAPPPSCTPSEPLEWPYCGRDATAANPVGCRGVHVAGHTVCLAHLTAADRDAYLAGLGPGSRVDHRGTTFTAPLLAALLDALRTPAGALRLGSADFGSAVFESDVRFDAAVFEGDASFEQAEFRGVALFHSTCFKGDAGFRASRFRDRARFERSVFEEFALFDSATFEDDAWFEHATFKDATAFEDAVAFKGDADFGYAVFEGGTKFSSASFARQAYFRGAAFREPVWFDTVAFQGKAVFEAAVFGHVAMFDGATFTDEARFKAAAFQSRASFSSAAFHDTAGFEGTSFACDVRFDRATFEGRHDLGPFVCAGTVSLSGAAFGGQATLSFAAHRLECTRTRWAAPAEMRVRYATADLSRALITSPLALVTENAPFSLPDGSALGEGAFEDAADARMRLLSLRGTDTTHLVLADVDLSECLFVGAVHLDRIRLEGVCAFDTTPPRPRRPGNGPRYTPRRTLAEEHHWRASLPRAAQGWKKAGRDAGQVGPAQLEPVYRALRRAQEAAGNRPWAADFAYGEREMRRHARTGTTRAERSLLHAYWLLSGYGLRASRTVGWLAVSTTLTVLLLMWAGTPQASPERETTGGAPAGAVAVTSGTGGPDPGGPAGEDRFTGERFAKSLDVAIGSLLFRSSEQPLTTAGGYVELAAGVSQPLLLGLTVLAVRNRVRR
ncbi:MULTISPECIES: pentapeptide repeat-containing protein [unclassified Streptomyces]|uniref:pentapeptide repeat-containing protein n=1 Tax=unclassified Streptomyces TaxID=2593676 RepID=UPI0036FC45E0